MYRVCNELRSTYKLAPSSPMPGWKEKMVLYEAMQKTSHFPPYLCQGRSCQCIVQEYGYMCIYEYILTVALSNCICGTLRSWGHLSFHNYLVQTGPTLCIFWLKNIFSDLHRYIECKFKQNWNTFVIIFLCCCHICVEKLSDRTDTKTQKFLWYILIWY